MGWPRGPLPRGARLPLGSGLWNHRPWARARGVGRAPGQPSCRRQAGRCPLPLGSSCRAGAGTDPGRWHGRPGPLVPRGLMAAGAGAPGSAPGGETGAAQSAGHLAARALVTHGTDLVPTGAAWPRVHQMRVRTCCLSAVLRHRPCFPLLRYGAAWTQGQDADQQRWSAEAAGCWGPGNAPGAALFRGGLSCGQVASGVD